MGGSHSGARMVSTPCRRSSTSVTNSRSQGHAGFRSTNGPYFADARDHIPEWWPPSIVVSELVCWASVAAVLGVAIHRAIAIGRLPSGRHDAGEIPVVIPDTRRVVGIVSYIDVLRVLQGVLEEEE